MSDRLDFRKYQDIVRKYLDAKSELIQAIFKYYDVRDMEEFNNDWPASFKELFLDDIFFI